jgi:hypothetical protein
LRAPSAFLKKGGENMGFLGELWKESRFTAIWVVGGISLYFAAYGIVLFLVCCDLQFLQPAVAWMFITSMAVFWIGFAIDFFRFVAFK